jgi:TrmH family RNA methyltransferase
VTQWSEARPLYNDSLLTESQRDRIHVVLVSPRNPLNTGAVARAMANFGFARLDVVAAYEPHWREARSAVGAPELLKTAKETETLAEAIADCTMVVGTGSLTHRKPEQPVVPLPALAPLVQRELDRGGRIALIFGPEKHGLTRDDFSYCNLLVEIPTDERQPSMNLGQAAAVCLYELASRSIPDLNCATERLQRDAVPPIESGLTELKAASSGHLEILSELIDHVMVATAYSPRTAQAANRHGIRLLLHRLHLNSADSRRILGLFRRILWHIRRLPERNVTN